MKFDPMNKKHQEKMKKIPPMNELKPMFDQVNADCKKSGESVVPYSDVEYYANQIHNIFFDNEGDNSDESFVAAQAAAETLYNYAKRKDRKVEESNMNEESNSFQAFQQEMAQKLNSKLYDRLMDMKKIIASKIVGETEAPKAKELDQKKEASPLQIAYRKHFKDSLQRHHGVDCISKVAPEKKGEFFKRLSAEWVPGKGSIHDGHTRD